MRFAMLSALVCGSLGCGVVPKESHYWHLSVGKAGSLQQSVPYQQSSGSIQTAPLMPVAPVAAPPAFIAPAQIWEPQRAKSVECLPMPRQVVNEQPAWVEEIRQWIRQLEERQKSQELLYRGLRNLVEK